MAKIVYPPDRGQVVRTARYVIAPKSFEVTSFFASSIEMQGTSPYTTPPSDYTTLHYSTVQYSIVRLARASPRCAKSELASREGLP